MKKPVILTVDDDVDVLRAVERDLRRQYGERFRVMRADSGLTALELVKQLKLRNEALALFLVDQRMPRMSGVEFLEQALKDFPTVKRALLTAYADTDAAINAINSVQIDYYLMKPWDPPEERLYPVLDDLLEDWLASFHPPFEGVRVVGLKWSPQAHAVKDFLARNQIPYQWLDVEIDPEARKLDEQAGDGTSLPLVLFPDGSHVREPTAELVAKKVGLKTRALMPSYDLGIVGAGPAGLAAAVYGASEGLTTVMIEREAPGGQAGSSSRIENYLGFPSGLSGGDLARRAVTQARRFGAEILTPQHATKIHLNGPYRVIALSDGSEISCQALLIATGVSYRRLEIPGVDKLTGAGVYYGAAATEAISCTNEDAYIVGAGNSAGQAAMYLSRFAKHVTLIVRGESLAKTMSQYLIDQIGKTPNITVQLRSRVIEAKGNGRLDEITIASEERPGDCAVHLYWRDAAYRRNRGFDPMRPAWLHLIRSRPDQPRRAPAKLDSPARSLSAGNKCSRNLCRRRRASWLDQAGSLGCRRGIDRHRISPSISEPILSATTHGTNSDSLLEQLRSIPLFTDLRDEDRDCIGRAEERRLVAGEILVRESTLATHFFVLLEGEVSVSKKYGDQRVVVARYRPGAFFGEVPLLLDVPYILTARAEQDSRLIVFPAEGFWALLRLCPLIAGEIFRAMAVRLRNLEGSNRQQEKLASLGRMSAGLAHELNNPAAAAQRIAVYLGEVIQTVQGVAHELHQTLEADHWDRLIRLADDALKNFAVGSNHSI